jgi:hypothetical protein
MKTYLFLVLLCSSLFMSCGNDDDSPSFNIVDTSADVTIDTNLTQFTKGGYALDLLASRKHRLVLHCNLVNASHGHYGSMQITTLFRDTVIDMTSRCSHNLFSEKGAIQVDFTEGDFSSQVISNNPNCFQASFSGSIETDDGLITISEGNASFVYDEPLEDYSIGRLSN